MLSSIHSSFRILIFPSIPFSFFLSLHFAHPLPPYLPSLPHLIIAALVNKCITHELIHGSFSSAPYGPTVKPQQLFKVFCKYVFSQLVQAVCDATEQGLLHFTSNNCTDKTPQELEKCRSADTFKRDREELNTWEGLTPPHTTNQL